MTLDNHGSDPSPHQQPVRGRPFQKGNGGRKPGSRNRATMVAQTLIESQLPELERKGYELAMGGNVQMLKFFLGPFLPKDRLVRIGLPEMVRADDAVDALGAIINAVAAGKITPNEAAALASVVSAYVKAINVHELEARLDEHDRKLRALRAI